MSLIWCAILPGSATAEFPYAIYETREGAAFDATEAVARQAAAAKALGMSVAESIALTDEVSLEMRICPAGEFPLGSPDSEMGREKDEALKRGVFAQPFYLSTYPLTQEQYVAIMDMLPGGTSEMKPGYAARVSYDETRRLLIPSMQKYAPEGWRFQLVTMDQMEYATRAGTLTTWYTGEDLKEFSTAAWHKGNSGGKEHPVGRKRANAWGFHDTLGNVWQWVTGFSDQWDDDPGEKHVVKGGGFDSPAGNNGCRSANVMLQGIPSGVRVAMVMIPDETSSAASDEHVEVDCSKTIRSLEHNPTGFCMSFVSDADRDGRKPFAPVLKSMNIGSLRYPMGTLAENYLFHDLRTGPPVEGGLKPRVISRRKAPAQWEAAVSAEGGLKSEVLDFDEYVDMCQQSGATPVIMVSSHGHLFPGSDFSEEDILRNAEEWVRYANITRKLGIRYWEIGNEVDLKEVRELMSREQYFELYQKMATRMKAVDPSIRTGVGTMFDREYTAQALKKFPELVDFTVIHPYMTQIKDFAHYAGTNGLRLGETESVLADIDEFAPPERRETTEVLMTEFSGFCAGANHVPELRRANSIFNAMLTFDMLASGISMDDRVRFMHFWVTHSPWGRAAQTDYANAFDVENNVLPQGRAIELMGRFLQERMVEVESPEGPLRCWAGASKDSSKIAVWLMNRAEDEKKIVIKLTEFKGSPELSTWSFAGESPDDTEPSWGAGKQVVIEDGRVTITVPAFSITVLHSPA
ncbi:MAG: SUMF1/EgtB/PvdO family nonheme iron enzyme [Luteolibacter sp.]